MKSFLHLLCSWTTLVTLVTCDDVIPNSVPLPPGYTLPGSSPHHHYHHESNTRLDTSAELVLGTFAQEQENAWFYETYYPIVLKLPIPDWSPDAHRLNRSAPRCENDDLKPNFMCPAQQHLDNLLIRLSHSTRFFKNIYTASLFSTDKDDRIYEDNPSCHKIRPHFYHFSTTLKGMEPYLEELRQKCPLAKDLRMIEKTLTSADLSQTTVRHAYERFTEQHNKNRPNENVTAVPSTNVTGNASASNVTLDKSAILARKKEKELWEFTQMVGFTTFQNAFTLFTYADSVRWSNAFTTCQGYRLDVNLLPPQVLMTILDEASRNLTRLGLGYNISIPFDSLLTHFYKLPLTDCVLAMEGASDAFLILRLLLPVTRYFKHYKLVKLNKVPFFIRQKPDKHLVHREVGSICEIKNYRYEELFLVEYDTSMRGDSMPLITSVMKAPLTCGPYHVCRIPEQVHRSLVDTCVEGIISRDEDATKEDCGFKCYPVSKKQVMDDFPYVIQLTSNKFAVVGAMLNETKGKKVTIQCFGRTRVDGLKQEKSDEATIVTLPCPCHISVAEATYYPESPCNGTLEIIHVTHVVGDGYDGFKLFEGGEKSKNIQDTMNGNKWSKGNGTEEEEKKKKKILPDELPTEFASEGDLNGEKKREGKTEGDDDGVTIPEEEYVLEDEAMFSIPFADNRRGDKAENGTSPEDLLIVLDASGGDGYVCTHAIMWVVGSFMLIWEITAFYILWSNGYISIDSILFMR